MAIGNARTSVRLSAWAAGLLLAMLLLPHGTHGQYFGRNKVQYETFDFKTLETPHYRILYYPESQPVIVDAGRMAERWYERFSTLFQHELEENQPVILYANHADFQQTNVISGLIGEGTGGVTEGMQNRVVMPLTGIYDENNHVLGHELVHAFQYSIMKESSGGLAAARGMPLWFVEGMAEYLSLGRENSLTAMWMRDAVLHEDVPSISDMSGNLSYFPYRFGHAFWAWVAGLYSDDIVPRLMYATVAAGYELALQEILSTPVDTLSARWKQAMHETYYPMIADRTKPLEVGEAALDEGEALMTLSPSISPDGRHAAFIARRDVFTLNLYLADLSTGEIVEQLASSNSDAHFDALQFTNGSGTWSPDGSKLAFTVFKGGDNALAMLDIESVTVERTIKLEGVDALLQAAWSPDGSRILISGNTGGLSDLYLYDLTSDEIEQLTNDTYAQIQPSWSPDGRTIAFATDAGGEYMPGDLTYGRLQIALMDLQSRELRFIAISDDAKHIDPQFGVNNDLYFVADPDGFSDIYRYSFDDGQFFRVTRIATGVTGLTEDSPALSVARESGTLLFTVFDDREYKLRRLATAEASGEAFSLEPTAYETGVSLPPQFVETTVSEYLAGSNGNGHANGNGNGNGHTDGATDELYRFQFRDYNPKLSLAYVGQTGVGVGFDRFGAQVGGGASFLFSDLLGNRVLGITAQASGRLKDIGGEIFYLNQGHRLNWGVAGGHIPFRSAFLRVSEATVGNQPVVRQELVREWTFFDRVDLMAVYPLSTNRRFEFTGGFSHVWYDRDAEGILVDRGFIIDEYQIDLPAPSPLNLGHVSGAYVGDYSLFGFTSPVRGTRYRLELEATAGTITFLTALADLRRYVYLSPFTLAFRGMHIGRYLDDAENERLSELFVGYPTLVRGYDAYSLEPEECTTGDCPVYNRLLGSRLAVVNAELRFPLFGTDEYGLVNFSYLPTELAAFFDGGVAWRSGDLPKLRFEQDSDERIPVFSTGLAARVNLFGFLVGQVFVAKPFQRPEKNVEWGFLIAPGW